MKSKAHWEEKLRYHEARLREFHKNPVPFPAPLPKGMTRQERIGHLNVHNQAARQDKKRKKALRQIAFCKSRIEALENRTCWDLLDRGIGV